MTSPDIVAIVLAGGASARFGSDKLAASLDGRPVLHHALEAVGAVADRIVVVIPPKAPLPSVPEVLAKRVVFARDAAAFGGPLAGLAAGLAALAAPVAADTPVLEEAPHITAAESGPAATAEAEAEAATAEAEAEAAAAATATAERAAEAGREATARRNRVVLVVGGDMPSLDPAVLRVLAESLEADPSLAAMTLAASDPAPLPMAVRPGSARSAIDAILASGGRRSLFTLLDTVPSAALPAERWRALDPTATTLRDVDRPSDLPG